MQIMIVPNYIKKIDYERCSVNQYIIPMDLETQEDLGDKKHLLSVAKSRLEYQQGKIVKTKEFLKKIR